MTEFAIGKGNRVRVRGWDKDSNEREYVGIVNGLAIAVDEELYVPVYIYSLGQSWSVHSSNILGNAAG